jgi:diguanylate cyclase (GGDEF)-like protein
MSFPGASPARGGVQSRSWLCGDDFDRARIIDMQRRLNPVRRRGYAILTLAMVALAPEIGWEPLLFVIPATACFTAADAFVPKVKHPEYLIFGGWLASVLALAGVVAVASGPKLALLPWLGTPVLTLGARFSIRGVLAGVALTVLVVVGVAFAADAHTVIDAPVLLVGTIALVLCAAVLGTPLMHSDIEHRSGAVVDRLTGMLNRKALDARAEELSKQSELRAEPVGIVVADIDHFKRINDTFGHAVGDAVLRNVAALLREHLRAFDLAYRIGGEEFVILLPGCDLGEAVELAGRLHLAVHSQETGDGRPVTMSFGVAASGEGERFDYASVFAAADDALYRAKNGGRDQVCVTEPALALSVSNGNRTGRS